MKSNFDNFSLDNVKKLMQSPAGKQLISLLQNADSSQLQNAAQKASDGNMEEAKKALAPLLASPQIQALLKQLGEQGHG